MRVGGGMGGLKSEYYLVYIDLFDFKKIYD